VVTRPIFVACEIELSAGAARGIRTPDPIITNDVLYQLSYCGFAKKTKDLGKIASPSKPLVPGPCPMRNYQERLRVQSRI
jgi:hypothetical protein